MLTFFKVSNIEFKSNNFRNIYQLIITRDDRGIYRYLVLSILIVLETFVPLASLSLPSSFSKTISANASLSAAEISIVITLLVLLINRIVSVVDNFTCDGLVHLSQHLSIVKAVKFVTHS